MGLAEAFDEATFTPKHGRKCGVQKAMEDNPGADADFLFRMATFDEGYPGHAEFSEWLKSQGIILSRKVLGSHRLKQCGCSDRMPERYES